MGLISLNAALSNTSHKLPTELLQLILMRMKITDAVRLSILSRKWRRAWTTTTNLHFDQKDFSHFEEHECCCLWNFRFAEFVDSVLSSHDGPILQFSLSTQIRRATTINRLINRLFSHRNRIQQLTLEICSLNDYVVPQLIFSCREMVHLSLSNCIINLPQNFEGFHNLQSLRLEMVSISSDELEKLVLSCKKLQKMVLEIWDCDFINIKMTKLRQLRVVGCFKNVGLANPYLTNLSFKSESNGAPQGLDSLFRCQALVFLEVSGVNLTIPKNFTSFDMLETLILSHVTGSIHDFECLISSCPRLRKLAMVRLYLPTFSNLHVHSATLQCLKIKMEDLLDLHLKTPRLKELTIGLNYLSNKWRGLDEDLTSQLNNPIRYSEVLAGLKSSLANTSAFSQLEVLSLFMAFGDVLAQMAAVCLLEEAHSLHNLKIKIYPTTNPIEEPGRSPCCWEDMEFTFKHLVQLKLDYLHGAHELMILKSILNRAPVLEEVIIKPGFSIPEVDVQCLLKELSTIYNNRLSKKPKIIIEPGIYVRHSLF